MTSAFDINNTSVRVLNVLLEEKKYAACLTIKLILVTDGHMERRNDPWAVAVQTGCEIPKL